MRMPIRLNSDYWPKWFTSLLPSAADPRAVLKSEIRGADYSKAISAFKLGVTYKTTEKSRYPIMISELRSLNYSSPPIILDIGVSDGINSLDLIHSIKFSKFYVTDLQFDVLHTRRGRNTYFYDPAGHCVLIATNVFIFYADFKHAIFPLNKIPQRMFSKAPSEGTTKARLVNPALDQFEFEDDVIIEKYDIFDTWTNGKVDLIIIANLLNRSYFSEDQISEALSNVVHALNNLGRFVIVDSRVIEKGTIFRVTDGVIEVEKDVNGGTEIKQVVLNF